MSLLNDDTTRNMTFMSPHPRHVPLQQVTVERYIVVTVHAATLPTAITVCFGLEFPQNCRLNTVTPKNIPYVSITYSQHVLFWDITVEEFDTNEHVTHVGGVWYVPFCDWSISTVETFVFSWQSETYINDTFEMYSGSWGQNVRAGVGGWAGLMTPLCDNKTR